MKRIAFLLFIAVLLAGCSSVPYSEISGPYQKIVELGKTKADIFNSSMQWVAQSFKSAKAVIQYSDKESGIINGNGTATAEFGGIGPTTLSYKFIFEIKDNKSRITFSEVMPVFDNSSSGRMAAGMTHGIGNNQWPRFTEWADNIINDYARFVKSNNSDW